MLNIKIKELNENAKMPTYGDPGAACFDLYSISDGCVPAGKSTLFSTGLAVEVPELHVMRVFSRSGHGYKNGIRLSNIVGIIDSSYRGELFIKLHNDSDVDYNVTQGERIAQACVDVVRPCNFIWSDELSETERGTNGLGSTGKL